MDIVNEMDNTEIPLPAFNQANQKYQGCKHIVQILGQKTCVLYNQKIETNMDVLSYCYNCLANQKSPTNKIKVRGP